MTDLDITTFNAPNGYVTTNFDSVPTIGSSCICRAIALQPNGKIVMAGDYDDIAITQKKVAVCRYNSNGTLDLSFGGSGTGKIAITIPGYSPNVQGLTLQSNGKIVICGTLYASFKDIFVMRLTSAGILDTAFITGFNAPTGYTITTSSQFSVVYPTLGFDNCEANSITMQTIGGNEYIVVGGTARGQVLSPLGPTIQYYALARYTLSGSLDTTFGSTLSGLVAQSFSLTDQYGLAIYADSNKILLAGNNSLPGPPATTTSTKMTVVKFSGNGVLDSTWGNQLPTQNGLTEIPNFFTQSYDTASAIVLQSDGNIVLGGSSINANPPSQRCFALARLLPTGFIDLGYGANGNGKVLTNLSPAYNLYGDTMGIQPDDKIILGGTWDILGTTPTSFALARYLTTGGLDTTFGLAGTGLILEDIDSTINPGGGCVETGYSLVIQPDGKILMGGELNQYLASEGGPTSFMLARYFGFPPFPPPPPPPPTPTPISNICFLAGTCVTTDQGDIPIELIVPDFHTIFNKPIIAVTETIMLEKKLVCFEKNSLGNNIPNKKTFISNNHVIVYNNKLIQAHRFVGRVRGVYYTKYNSEFLYNILMEKHFVIKVNNLKVETLYPKNFVAHLYTYNYTPQEKRNIILKMNEQAIKIDEQKKRHFDILNYNNVRNTQFTKRCVQKSNFLIATHNNATLRRNPLLGKITQNNNFNLFTRKYSIFNKKFMMVKSNKRFRR